MNKLRIRREQQQAFWRETPWDDVATYIGPNAAQFRTVWDKQRSQILKKGSGITWSFCWPVFFLSFVWLFYRKQYLAGAVLIIVPVVLGMLFPTASGAFGGIAIAIATMAKSLYLQDAIPKIARIRATIPDEATREAALKATGGTSKPAGIISLIVFIGAILATIWSLTMQS